MGIHHATPVRRRSSGSFDSGSLLDLGKRDLGLAPVVSVADQGAAAGEWFGERVVVAQGLLAGAVEDVVAN